MFSATFPSVTLLRGLSPFYSPHFKPTASELKEFFDRCVWVYGLFWVGFLAGVLFFFWGRFWAFFGLLLGWGGVVWVCGAVERVRLLWMIRVFF